MNYLEWRRLVKSMDSNIPLIYINGESMDDMMVRSHSHYTWYERKPNIFIRFLRWIRRCLNGLV